MNSPTLGLASLFFALSLTPLGAGQSSVYIGGRPVGKVATPATPTAASGAGCPLLSSCAHPNSNNGGLAIDPDGSVWVGTYGSGDSAYKVDPATCAVLSQIPIPEFSGGIAHDGTDLWICAEQLGEAHRFDPVNGALLQILPLPGSTQTDPNSAGLAWDGQALWHAEYLPGGIYRIDPTSGAVLQTISPPSQTISGVAYSNGQLRIADYANNVIYTIDAATGVLLDTCTATGRPWGLGYASDGLWTSDFGSSSTISRLESGSGISTNYCGPAVPNSTGQSGEIGGEGSASVTANDLTLVGSSLPPSSFGLFLTSLTQGFVMNPGGSQGNLCLIGAVGRFAGPGQIQQVDASGEVRLLVDVTMLPTPTGLVAAMPGESWSFQTWYRDSVGGTATSNFTDGLEVTFY